MTPPAIILTTGSVCAAWSAFTGLYAYLTRDLGARAAHRKPALRRRAWRAWRGWVARQHERAAVRQIERDRLAPEDALTVAWAQGLHRLLPERWDLAALAALRVITETAPASPWRYPVGSLGQQCGVRGAW